MASGDGTKGRQVSHVRCPGHSTPESREASLYRATFPRFLLRVQKWPASFEEWIDLLRKERELDDQVQQGTSSSRRSVIGERS
eukprot:Skav214483  [mRNA]  locus=scaffold1167:417798:422127:+ [translate_table: standard]